MEFNRITRLRRAQCGVLDWPAGAGKAVEKRAPGQPAVVERDDRRISVTVLGGRGTEWPEPAGGARQSQRRWYGGLPPHAPIEVALRAVLSDSIVSLFRVDQVPQRVTAHRHLRP